MAKISAFERRYSELSSQADKVLATASPAQGQYRTGLDVDVPLLINWKVKARHLLSASCGPDSIHLRQFLKSEGGSLYRGNVDEFTVLRAVFEAAREDFEGGYLTSVQALVQAELFDNELDQARELLSNGYKSAAAVIAGVVLETTLRQLCAAAQIASGKLDKMNADLVKAGVYNLLVQKRITALADIRNNAAHGHPDKFAERDVEDMISYVEAFLSERL